MSLACFTPAEPAVAEGPKGTPETRPQRPLRTILARTDAVTTPEPR